MTNLEKIRQMDAHAMEEFLMEISGCCFDYGRGYSHCEECPLNDGCNGDDFIQWLEEEANDA